MVASSSAPRDPTDLGGPKVLPPSVDDQVVIGTPGSEWQHSAATTSITPTEGERTRVRPNAVSSPCASGSWTVWEQARAPRGSVQLVMACAPQVCQARWAVPPGSSSGLERKNSALPTGNGWE